MAVSPCVARSLNRRAVYQREATFAGDLNAFDLDGAASASMGSNVLVAFVALVAMPLRLSSAYERVRKTPCDGA
jgi:hypothetical protein